MVEITIGTYNRIKNAVEKTNDPEIKKEFDQTTRFDNPVVHFRIPTDVYTHIISSLVNKNIEPKEWGDIMRGNGYEDGYFNMHYRKFKKE